MLSSRSDVAGSSKRRTWRTQREEHVENEHVEDEHVLGMDVLGNILGMFLHII